MPSIPGMPVSLLVTRSPSLLGRRRVEGEHQDLVWLRQTFADHVARFRNHGRGLARPCSRDNHDVVVHAYAGIDLLGCERVLLDSVEEVFPCLSLTNKEAVVVLLDLRSDQVRGGGLANGVRPARAFPDRRRMQGCVLRGHALRHPSVVRELGGDLRAPGRQGTGEV